MIRFYSSVAARGANNWSPRPAAQQGNPITYDAYGTGTAPILWGSNVLTNANFVSAGGNNYTYNIPNLVAWPNGVYVLVNNAFLGTNASTYNNPTLTITSPTNPRD